MTALHAAGGGLPLALHIPHVVEQAGSIAGFAAIIGLAVLSALYFSQARDLRRLREWAGRAPERAAEGQPAGPVPGRVVAVPQQQRPAQPGAAPVPATPTAAAAPANGEATKTEQADGSKPDEAVATNGDAAPKVTAGGAEAAKDEEGKDDEAAAAKPGMPAPASAAAAAAGAGAKSVSGPAAPATTPGDGAAASTPGTPASTPGGAAAPAAGGAAAGAAAAAGSGAAAPPKPAGPQAPEAGTPSGPRPAAQPQRPPGSVLPPRTGTLPPVRRLPSSNVSPAQTGVLGSAEPPKKKRNPVYIVLAVAGVLVLGAAAAIGVPALVNGTKDDNSSGSDAAKKTDSTTTKKKAVAAAPDKITVAVLNGTGIPGLAAQVGDRVDAEGFTLGTVSNASQADGQRANSVAMYASGHKADAEQVAKKLNIGNVSRIDSNSQAIAGDASVVVIVGSDKTQ
jgi:LytR cell envelope-related transcriptional attenuator